MGRGYPACGIAPALEEIMILMRSLRPEPGQTVLTALKRVCVRCRGAWKGALPFCWRQKVSWTEQDHLGKELASQSDWERKVGY